MALTQRFRDLKVRLGELRRHLLPKTFSDTGDYPERVLDRARGYRLLVHAEIEAYLEDVSRRVVTKAVQEWKNNGQPSNVMISFIASYHSSWNVDSEIKNEEIIKIAKSRKNAKDSVTEIVNLAQTQFSKKLKDNHGIKENNFKTIIMPTGIDIARLDQTWLTSMNEFGKKRGDVAHNNKSVSSTINPQDELNTVRDLIRGLKELDEMIHPFMD